MKKLNKLLNDISKNPISFHNMETSLMGTIVFQDVIMNEPDNILYCVDYRFNGFIQSETTWKIDIKVGCPDIKKEFQYKNDKEKLIKRRIYKLLLIISNLEEVLEKINT